MPRGLGNPHEDAREVRLFERGCVWLLVADGFFEIDILEKRSGREGMLGSLHISHCFGQSLVMRDDFDGAKFVLLMDY